MKSEKSTTKTASPKPAATCSRKQIVTGLSLVALLLAMMTASGCAQLSAGKKAVWRLNPFASNKDDASSNITAFDLQLELMRFADDFSSMAGEVADGLAAKAKTPADRVRPLALKVSQANAAISIASNPNPLAGVLDMVVMVSLTRASFENYLIPTAFRDDAKGVIEKYRKSEEGAWTLAAKILDSSQLDELKKAIDQWQIDNPDQHYVSFVRLQNLNRPSAAMAYKDRAPWSIFSLLRLDPFAGLDPAAREIETSRHTAERAMYQLQKAPRLLDWQFSLALAKTLALPEVKGLLSAVDRLCLTTEELPKKIAEERVAIVKELEANDPKVRSLLTEVRETLKAGENTSKAVNETVLSISNLASNLNKGAAQDHMNTPAAKPFDIADYSAVATQITSAVREMNTLANSADQKLLPQTEATISLAKSAGTEFVDHVFRKAVAFVLITLVGTVIAMLAYRALAPRFSKAE